MEICTLASGSSGNCTMVRTEQGTILIDAGISCKRICTGLQVHQVDPASLNGILITHEHSDHISGLNVFLKKYRIPIYTSAPTGRQLSYRIAGIDELIQPVESGKTFSVGTLEVMPFHTPHDAAQSMGFSFSDGVKRGALATDMGRVTDEIVDAVCGSDFVLLEMNYEREWLLGGPYPMSLKKRILSERGHLSNEDGAAFAEYLVHRGTKTLVLGHLSKENNSPDQAYTVAENRLQRMGVVAGEDVMLEVAPRNESSRIFYV